MAVKYIFISVLFGFMLFSYSVYAGVVIGGTRIIYPSDKREVSLQLFNKDKVDYLVQSWAESENKGKPDFIITPPLQRIEGGENNTLRIMRMTENLPENRETLQWVNIKVIPPSAAEGEQNTLQIAIKSRLKLIYRPVALNNKTPEDVANLLKWTRIGATLQVNNPTPYYMNFSNISIGGKELQDVTYVAPSSTLSFPIPANTAGNSVRWSLITDFGGSGPVHTTTL
ncbi:long polar fimbrial chaperone LpfB [Leclercia adecarboxylata]|nr:long polar fimbrial chaperone LpfB [Leclercia adecarboxylata]KMN63739.1 long polar fimbrial chaperone LpfB [Leclercia sp. LK8]